MIDKKDFLEALEIMYDMMIFTNMNVSTAYKLEKLIKKIKAQIELEEFESNDNELTL